MLSICQICLSTDKSLQALKEPLSNWHDELCDFGIEDFALYCPECAYMLTKFHNFKEKCLLANKILKKWKKQSQKVRIHASQLKKEMPPPPLALSNVNNHKIFYYQSLEDQYFTELRSPNIYTIKNSGFIIDTNWAVDSEKFPSNPEISTPNCLESDVNILSSDNDILRSNDMLSSNNDMLRSGNIQPDEDTLSNVKYLKEITEDHPDNANILNIDESCSLKTILIEPCNENEFLKESDMKVETDALNTEAITEDIDVKSDFDSDIYVSDHNISDSDSDFEKMLKETYDSNNSSDDETLFKKRKRSLKADGDIKKVKKKIKTVDNEETTDPPFNKIKKIKEKDAKSKKIRRPMPLKDSLKKINLDSIKYNLLCKFGNKELKDVDGNVIDKDCIIDNLDKLHKYTLNKVKRHCLGSKPFTPEAIQVLSQIQKRYGNQFSSVFTMEHLTTTEQMIEEFNKRQQHESFLNSEHRCMMCLRGFKHSKLLDYHMLEYHNPERPLECPICHMRFKGAPSLCKHNAAHRSVYKCKLCPLVTNYRTVMENHYNLHNGVKYTCSLCDAVLNSKTSLNAHINYVHPSRYVCALCARTFVSEVGLMQHKIRKHQNQEMIEGPDNKRCETCDITFISESVYESHVAKSHAEKCTAENYAVTYRKRKMSGKRQTPNFVCRVCKRVEHSMGRMVWHFKQEHPRENTDSVSMCAQPYKYLCHECGKGYSNITDFNEHKHLHTGAKPYACDKCPKAFHRKTNLRSHLERHFPPTRECQHCGKKFLSAANLNNHVRMHIGIRRYTCELCSKTFLHQSALNAHVRGVHLRIRRTRKPNKEPTE